jgi:hypothetical protein
MKSRVWSLLLVVLLATVVGCGDKKKENTSKDGKDDSKQTANGSSDKAEPKDSDSNKSPKDGGAAKPGGSGDQRGGKTTGPDTKTNQPGAKVSIADTELAFITDEFVGGLIVRPRQMAQSPLGKELNVDEFFSTAIDEDMPFKVSDLERVEAFATAPGPPFGEPKTLFSFTFATADVLAKIRKEELPPLKPVQHAGKEYFNPDFPDFKSSGSKFDEGDLPPEDFDDGGADLGEGEDKIEFKEPGIDDVKLPECDVEETIIVVEAEEEPAVIGVAEEPDAESTEPGIPREGFDGPEGFDEPPHFEEVERDRQAFYFPNDRTMIFAPDSVMKNILESKGPSGPIADLLKNVDVNHDFVAFGVMGPLNALLDDLPPEAMRRMPKEATMALGMRKFVDSAVFTADLNGPNLAHLAIDSPDESMAKQLHAGIKLLVGFGQAAFTDNRDQIAAELPPGIPEGGLKIVTELVAGVATNVEADRVSLTVKLPPSWDEVPGIVKELMASAKEAQARNKRQMLARNVAFAFLIASQENDKLIAAAAPEKADGPPVSWRVRALPYLERQDLYDEYRLDEPWDSEHNLKLVKQMPEEFGDDPDGKTAFMLFTGEGSSFSNPAVATPMSIVQDGHSNTILLVEAGPDVAVPWTKPQDLAFNPKDPAAALGEVPEDGFTAVFLDSHTEVLPKEMDAEELKALITPAGGEKSGRRFGDEFPGSDADSKARDFSEPDDAIIESLDGPERRPIEGRDVPEKLELDEAEPDEVKPTPPPATLKVEEVKVPESVPKQ